MDAMMDDITIATFADRVGSPFQIRLDPEPAYEVVLADVIDHSAGRRQPPAGMRTPFSLVFRGPRDTYLPQGLYRMEHAELGALDIFLVPVQPDAEGSLYEAVFG